ncbi:MAG: hypothetical protein UR26_C0007G0016 [candidate division TM6 bacterium GW2011_GWF2_32_72]|nr:MAG: hypothetical protein UR26_C0007G0016 [candidate division TM6 bacterium GW2011_GWF2_32_72]
MCGCSFNDKNCNTKLNNFSGHKHTTIWDELVCHLPYAVLSVAFGLILISFLDYYKFAFNDEKIMRKGAHGLFHSFHFLHLVFSSLGTVIAFSRYSKSIFKAIFIGTVAPIVFCVLSDVVLPYYGGRMLGANMHWHFCFYSELHQVLPFLFAGLLTGLLLSRHGDALQSFYSFSSHFTHILVSSLASLFYLVSEGLYNWQPQMGMVFLFLIAAVVIPCTFSDVIVPITFAKWGDKNEKH